MGNTQCSLLFPPAFPIHTPEKDASAAFPPSPLLKARHHTSETISTNSSQDYLFLKNLPNNKFSSSHSQTPQLSADK